MENKMRQQDIPCCLVSRDLMVGNEKVSYPFSLVVIFRILKTINHNKLSVVINRNMICLLHKYHKATSIEPLVFPILSFLLDFL